MKKILYLYVLLFSVQAFASSLYQQAMTRHNRNRSLMSQLRPDSQKALCECASQEVAFAITQFVSEIVKQQRNACINQIYDFAVKVDQDVVLRPTWQDDNSVYDLCDHIKQTQPYAIIKAKYFIELQNPETEKIFFEDLCKHLVQARQSFLLTSSKKSGKRSLIN